MFSVVPRSHPLPSHFVLIHAQDGSYSPHQIFPFAVDPKITELFLATLEANKTKSVLSPETPLSPLYAQSLNVLMPPPCRPKSVEELETLKYTYVYMCNCGKDIEGVLTPSEAYLARSLIEQDYEPDFVKEDLI